MSDTIYAVLTGDLVDSSGHPGKEKASKTLKQLAQELSERHPGALSGKLDVFRGDSWQLCLAQPELALEASLFMRAGLKASPLSKSRTLDSRIAIGFGKVDHFNKQNISESSGPAFLASGEALDALQQETTQEKKQCLRIRWANKDRAMRVLDEIVLPLLDLQISEWSRIQSIAVFGALLGLTQKKTAEHQFVIAEKEKPTSQQSIQKALNRTHWHSFIRPTLDEIKILLKESIDGTED